LKITGLHVEEFGIWSDLRIDKISNGLTLFHGPNEAGKTTLMQFVRAVLYGFGADRAKRYLVPVAGRIRSSHTGGVLNVDAGKDGYQIRRTVNPSEPDSEEGILQVLSEEGARVGGHRLQTLLSGLDETIYNNVFAVGLSEIQHLGALNDTAAAHELYRLSTGGDRVSLVEVMRQLHDARASLISADGQSSRLGQLLDLRGHCRQEVADLSAATNKWANLKAEIRGLAEDMRRHEARRDQLQAKLQTTELAERVRPKWLELQKLDEEIDALGSPPSVPDSKFEEIKEIKQQIKQRRQSFTDLKKRRSGLRNQATSLPVSEVLRLRSNRIQALLDQRPWIQSLSSQIDQLGKQLSSAENDIRGHQTELGLTAQSDDDIVTTLDRQSASALRGPARQLSHDRQSLKKTKQQVAKHRVEVQKYQRQMASLAARDKLEGKSVVRTVDSIRQRIGGLKHRLQLDESIQQLTEQIQPVAERRRSLLDRQFAPPHVNGALGFSFAVGSAVLLCGVFIDRLNIDGGRRELLIMSGIAICGLVAMIRFLSTSSARVDLEACQQQYRSLRSRLTELESEREASREGIPATTPEVRLVLRESKDRLERLEKLIPIDARIQETQIQLDVAKRNGVEIAQRMKRSTERWRQALTSLGLSSKLTPAEVRKALSPDSPFGTMRRNLGQIEYELNRSKSEMSMFQDRLIDVFAEAKLEPQGDEPLELLRQLEATILEQQQLREQRDELGRDARKLRRDQDGFASEIRRRRRRIGAIVSTAGALDESELRTMKQQYVLARKLVRQRKDLRRDLDRIWGDEKSQVPIKALLARFSKDELDGQLARLRSDLESVHKTLTNLAHRHGELSQQLKSMLEEKESPEAHLRLSMVQRRLEEGISQWKVVSAITSLLKSVYKKYEKERQPEVLARATEYLSRMTEGRYSRIWTPLAEDVLRIDDADGNPLPVELLSRGAREQVFLSLRLALIDSFNQRGIRMPIILDDVFVNFDRQRTLAAARVISDFSQAGNQVLMFTCHDHLVDMFGSFEVDLRPIPKRSQTITLERRAAELPGFQPVPDAVVPPLELLAEVDAA